MVLALAEAFKPRGGMATMTTAYEIFRSFNWVKIPLGPLTMAAALAACGDMHPDQGEEGPPCEVGDPVPEGFTCLSLGVCAGTEPECNPLRGWDCPYPWTYVPASEALDGAWCDGRDNDCNGQVDEHFMALDCTCPDGHAGRLACAGTPYGEVVCQ